MIPDAILPMMAAYARAEAQRRTPAPTRGISMTVEPEPTEPTEAIDQEAEAFLRVLRMESPTMRDFDIDAFADGVMAHRAGAGVHENPHPRRGTVAHLSWLVGWNERALKGGD